MKDLRTALRSRPADGNGYAPADASLITDPAELGSSRVSAWDAVKLARHLQRPHALHLIERVFGRFQELHGDRMYADDQAIVGGLARLGGAPVMVIGQQKGRDTKERVRRNYGMPKPEGYRKARRLMQTAERFRLPLVTLIDTPGA